MPSPLQLPEVGLTHDARTGLVRMDISSDNTNTTDMNQSTNGGDGADTPTAASAAGANSASHSPNNSPVRSPSLSGTMTAISQASSDTITSPNPKLTIREYTLWKASGITPYSVYLAWKEDNMDMDVDLENMVKLKDMPHIKGREERAEKNVQVGLER